MLIAAVTIWGRVNAYYHLMLEQTTRNSPDWGHIHILADRPVFAFLDFEANRLRERDDLCVFNSPPDTNHETGGMLSDFFALPPGHALAVMQANYPRRSPLAERMFRIANKLLDKTRADFRIGYTGNFLHSFIADFIEQNPKFVRDYYLNFTAEGGATVLVRSG